MESYFSVGGSAGSDDVERVEDPADADQDLNSRLNSQREEGKKKMDQVRQCSPIIYHRHSKLLLLYTKLRKLKTQAKISNLSEKTSAKIPSKPNHGQFYSNMDKILLGVFWGRNGL